MKICPFCQQDVVWHVRLTPIPAQDFFMCFECDAVWLEGQPVSDQAGTTFDKHMHSLGFRDGRTLRGSKCSVNT